MNEIEDKYLHSGNVTKLIPTRPDAEVAAEYKQRIIEASEAVLIVLEEAVKAGFTINIGYGMGPLGKMVIGQLIIGKQF